MNKLLNSIVGKSFKSMCVEICLNGKVMYKCCHQKFSIQKDLRTFLMVQDMKKIMNSFTDENARKKVFEFH